MTAVLAVVACAAVAAAASGSASLAQAGQRAAGLERETGVAAEEDRGRPVNETRSEPPDRRNDDSGGPAAGAANTDTPRLLMPLLAREASTQVAPALYTASHQEVEGPRDRRLWLAGILHAGFGDDSNVFVRSDAVDPGQPKRDEFFESGLGVDFRYTKLRQAPNGAPGKAWEVGLLGHTAHVEQRDLLDASLTRNDLGAYYERRFFDDDDNDNDDNGKDDDDRSWFHAGLMLRYSDVRVGGRSFGDAVEATLAGSWAFGERDDDPWDECDLNRLVGYVSYRSVDDNQRTAVRELDRTGHHAAVGARYTLSSDKKSKDWHCQGGSVFRPLAFLSYNVLNVGYEHRAERTDGFEFVRDVGLLSVDGQWPLIVRDTSRQSQRAPRLVLDVGVLYGRIDHRNVSEFGVERPDVTHLEADLGLIIPLSTEGERLPPDSAGENFIDAALRVGVLYVDQNANVPAYEYDRTAYTIAVRIEFHRQAVSFRLRDGAVLPRNPGSHVGSETGSGPIRPILESSLFSSGP